jgi:predicted PhzF superfamily epimerase YddE/YHI9
MQTLEAGEFAWCAVFSPHLSEGNQTVVIRLQSWPERRVLGAMARFVGHETTFVVFEQDKLEMRWFAGQHEVPLCGHCALAACAVFASRLKDNELLEVNNLRGKLWLSRMGHEAHVVFPAARLTEVPAGSFALGIPVLRAFDAGRDYLFILENEDLLKKFDPQAAGIEDLDKIGCIVSSPSLSSTAAFRFFAPRVGIKEDRASGSVIPALMEYWVQGKPDEHSFHQASGYDIRIRARRFGDRVGVSGEVIEFARGKLAQHAAATGTPSFPELQPAR